MIEIVYHLSVVDKLNFLFTFSLNLRVGGWFATDFDGNLMFFINKQINEINKIS